MDYVRRDLLTGGGLKKYIDNDGLRGMTSNPAIFEKAITGSNLYNDILTSPEAKKLDANGIFEKIAIRDVQDACDIFKTGVCGNETARRLREPGSFTVSRLRYQGLARGSSPPLEGRGSPERHDQNSRHARRAPRHTPGPRRRHQHQYHAAFRAIGIRTGCRSVSVCTRGSGGKGPGH